MIDSRTLALMCAAAALVACGEPEAQTQRAALEGSDARTPALDAATPDARAPALDAAPPTLDAGPSPPVEDAALLPPEDAAPPPPDAAPSAPPTTPPDPTRCAQWDDVPDAALLAALHTTLHATYAPIDALPDLGGNPNRYTTARNQMFVQAEYALAEGAPGFECVYTGEFFAAPSPVEPDDNLLNCEHVWPRSRMAPEGTLLYSHEQSDMHHLYPALPGANSTRGSLPYGEVVAVRHDEWAPSLEGTDAEGRVVFEPRDVRKGDLARAVLYFAVRWGGELGDDEEATLRAWHDADPPSAREAARNDLVEGLQGNRNPFTDCPDLVTRVPDFAPFEPLDTESNLARP